MARARDNWGTKGLNREIVYFYEKNTANNYTKRLVNFLGINIIVFLVGLFMGILALYLSFGILAKLAIVLMGASAIIDSKGNIRF